jgi:hypothetical protein
MRLASASSELLHEKTFSLGRRSIAKTLQGVEERFCS